MHFFVLRISNLTMILLGSALSDLNLIPKSWFFVGGLTISGFGLTYLPFVEQYSWVCLICSIFGLATGTYVGITGEQLLIIQ